MVSVRFVHHHTIDGVSYLPGDVVALSPVLAAQLVYASRAVYTTAPPPPPPADPFPQYVLDTDLTTVAMAVLVAGSNVTIDKNPATGKATISATVTGGVDAEGVRDAVWAALRGTNGVQVSQDDASDTITITLTNVPTSAITGLDAALAAKAPLASPAFTGTVTGITKAMVGLGSVNNTSDANKPVSTPQQAALNAKVDDADVAEAATGSKIVVRTLGGQIKVTDPTADDEATTRGWVNTQLAGIGGGTTAVPRRSRLLVASSESPQNVKDGADYVCDGTNDQEEINLALLRATRPGDGFGGEGHVGVELVGPTFFVGHDNATSITMYPNTALRGNGAGTLISPQYTTVGIDRGVIELINPDASRTTVEHLSIARKTFQSWEGHGIKYVGSGQGQQYEIKTGNDPFHRILHVNMVRALGKGIWTQGVTGGARAMQINYCVLHNINEQGILSESSDAQIADCTTSGGGAFAGFELAGGNTRLKGCKAHNRGEGPDIPVTTGADGILVNSSRCEIIGCAAQDNGGYGLNVSGPDVTVTHFLSDSNTTGYRIAADGTFHNISALARTGGSQTQNVGILFAGAPKVMMTGKVDLWAATGTAHVSGSPGADSFVRVLRVGAGATAQPETLYAVG